MAFLFAGANMGIELPRPIAVTPVPNVRYREFTKCGQKPLSGGEIWTYDANSTTPKITYKDPYGLTPNTNPIVLDAAGEADIFLNGTYRFVVKDRSGVIQKDISKIGSWYSGDLDDQMKSVNDLLESSAQTLMQPLQDAINAAMAAGAGANGWDEGLIKTAISDATNQLALNRKTTTVVESITNLAALEKWEGRTVYVNMKGGGGIFIYLDQNKNINTDLIAYGWTRQDLTKLTPEMFGAVANKWEFDNTEALNKAFATGQDIYSTPDKIYTVNGNLRTKGQRCFGSWKIRTSKNVIGDPNWVSTANTYDAPADFSYLQGIYCAYAYDLSELFAIRDLGYNTLLHYGGMHISGYDNDGTVQNLLDNAKTAGLQVFLGTQNSLNGMSLPDFVNKYKDHPSVLGFLIADEPRHNGISITDQEVKINLMRTLTSKPLACSDFTFDPFTEVLASGYDYIFGDIYNENGETAEQTLYKMRAWLGLTAKRHSRARVLPAIMGFKYKNGISLEIIVQTSTIFAKTCGGNFACFAWDAGGESTISNSIRETPLLQGLSKEICGYKTGVYKIPKCYVWGTLSESLDQKQYGLSDVLEHHVRQDPFSTSGYEGINCYPVQMNGGSAEGNRTTPYLTNNVGLAGIWFKGTYGAYISDIPMKKYNHITVHSGMLAQGQASVTLSVRGTTTGGYGIGGPIASLPTNSTVETKTFEYESSTDMFCIKYDCSVDPVFYRTFIRGVYITSDW